jgi:probable F420-dependent oxidoreductase
VVGVAATRDHFGLGRVGVWTFALDLQPMRKAQEAASELEELGYGCIWVPEAVGREPFASCALLLSGTERISVATGIASMYARSATTMQAGWRTLTEAFGERFTLGIGASHEHMATKLHKGSYDKPYSTMVAYLDQMDKGIFAASTPTTAPRRVLAALGPRMLALSAQRGLGAHPYFVPPEHTMMAREVLGEGPLLAPEQAVLLETDPAKARETARKFMATYIRLPNYANNLRRLGYGDDDLGDATRPPSDRMVDAIVAWGTIEQVLARVKAHFDAGASHVSIQVLDHDFMALPMRQWRELAAATKNL